MNFRDIIESSRKNRVSEDAQVVEAQYQKVAEGSNKVVYKAPRGYVVTEIYLEGNRDAMAQSEMLEGVEEIPWHEVNQTDEEKLIITMRAADYSHEEAAEKWGVGEAIASEITMFESLARQDILYSDFKPANTGFFYQGDGYVAKPVDVIGEENWITQDVRLNDFQRCLEFYIQGGPSEKGITDAHNMSIEQAEDYVIQALLDDPEEIIENEYKDIYDAAREKYSSLFQSQ